MDYSKAVVITDEDYIDRTRKAFLRPNEYKKLRGKDYTIKQQFENYVELYKQAKVDETVDHREEILTFSTLQYFEEYIYPKETKSSKEQIETKETESTEETK